MSDTPLRNKPKQARSLRRFNHILDVAAQLFAEQGVENVSTNHIAAAAEVSIGSLYRFFPNKEVILEALSERYMEKMAVLFSTTTDKSIPYEVVLGNLIDNMLFFEQQHAAFGTIFLDAPDNNPTGKNIHELLVTHIDGLIRAYYPQLTDSDRRVCAMVGLGIVRGLMPLREAPYNLATEQLAAELKAALLAYLHDFLERR